VLAPSVSLPEALGRLLGKSRPPAWIPVQADNGIGERGDVLGFEEFHHLLVKIARDRAGSWRHARNSHADVLEQLGGQHDVGATADAQRNQPDVGVLDQVRDALDRHEAFTERDDVAQIETVPQLEKPAPFLAGPDDPEFQARYNLSRFGHCHDGDVEAETARERAVVNEHERCLG